MRVLRQVLRGGIFVAYLLLAEASMSHPVAEALNVWTNRNGWPALPPLSAIASGNGTIVAVGPRGYVATSNGDGTWTNRNSGVTNSLNRVAFGNGVFVAVGGEGTLLTSNDRGQTWVRRNSGTAAALRGIAWGNGRFVAGGFSDAMLTSDDGIEWKPQIFGTAAAIHSVSFGEGRFVAAGNGLFLTSLDGVNWSITLSAADYRDITFGHGQFVAVAANGATAVSANGVVWTSGTTGISHSVGVGISFGAGNFVVASGGSVARSTNGLDWEATFLGPFLFLTGVQFTHEGVFVFSGFPSSTLLLSREGGHWENRSRVPADILPRFRGARVSPAVLPDHLPVNWRDAPTGGLRPLTRRRGGRCNQ